MILVGRGLCPAAMRPRRGARPRPTETGLTESGCRCEAAARAKRGAEGVHGEIVEEEVGSPPREAEAIVPPAFQRARVVIGQEELPVHEPAQRAAAALDAHVVG